MLNLVIDNRISDSSGIGKYVTNLIPYLIDYYNITLLCPSNFLIDKKIKDKVKIVTVDAKIYSLSEQLYLFKNIPSCDIFWSPHWNIPILKIPAKKRIVTICDTYHMYNYKNLTFFQKIYCSIIMRLALLYSDLVFTISQFSKSEIKKYLNTENVKVINLGVDHEFFNVINYQEEKKKYLQSKYSIPDSYILFVGNVKPHKNLLTLVRALKLLPNKNLVIAGKFEGLITTDKELFKMIHEDKDLNKRIFFTGYFNNDDLPFLYKYADVFVFPSIYEGFGLPILEAQASGCPVISSFAASLPEVCNKSVLYIDPLNPYSIKEKVIESDDINKRSELIRLGYINCKNFTWKATSTSTIKHFESLF